MKIIKGQQFIEYVGHFEDEVLCAKLTLLADLCAVEHRNGYAKFKVEDEDKLRLINNELEFLDEPTPKRYFRLENTLEILGLFEGDGIWIKSDGIYNFSTGALMWAAAELNSTGTFLGLSLSPGQSSPDSNLAVGQVYFPDNSVTNLYTVFSRTETSTTVTNLMGTTWHINALTYNGVTMNGQEEWSFSLNFSTYRETFNTFYFYTSPNSWLELEYDSTVAARAINGITWTSSIYADVTFTGGTDATNSELISWLYANATLVNGWNVGGEDIGGEDTSSTLSQIFISSNQASDLFFGANRVEKVYLGQSKIYEYASASHQTITFIEGTASTPIGQFNLSNGDILYVYSGINSEYDEMGIWFETESGIDIVGYIEAYGTGPCEQELYSSNRCCFSFWGSTLDAFDTMNDDVNTIYIFKYSYDEHSPSHSQEDAAWLAYYKSIDNLIAKIVNVDNNYLLELVEG